MRLAGAKDLHRTTAALDDAGQRLSRLFLTQLALNAAFGLVIGAALWLHWRAERSTLGHAGNDYAFCAVHRRVYLRNFSFSTCGGRRSRLTMVLMTAALFLVAETIVGQAIEPLIYGHSTGLSPVAVITAATFWTWLWGPIR